MAAASPRRRRNNGHGSVDRSSRTTTRAYKTLLFFCYLVLLLALCDCAASSYQGNNVLPLFVKATKKAHGSGETGGEDGWRWEDDTAGDTCGSSEEDACQDIRSALLAVPEGMDEGSWPELRLLPGLYAGNRNVFIGGIGDTEYPSAARNVSIVGWVASPHVAEEPAHAYASTAAVISCQGRRSDSDSHPPARGIWLGKGRITSLANLTVTDCPAGGVGVEAWAGDDPFSSPVLSSVTVSGNGGDKCDKGGGVFVTSASSEEGRGSASVDTTRTRRGYQTVPGLTVSGCVIRNNTARSGGGMAISSAPPPLLLASRPKATPTPPELAEKSSKYPGQAPTRPVEEEASSLAGEARSRNHRFDRTGSNIRRGGALVGASAEEEGSSGGGALLSVVVNGGTVLSENRATSGGGVWASGGAVSAMGGVVLRDNVAGALQEGCGDEVSCGGRGGGMCIDGGSLSLEGVSFEGNRAETHQARDEYAKGGGLAARSCSVSARGCHFSGNGATAMAKASAGIGGGAYLDDSDASLSGCRFENNMAEGIDLFGQLASFGAGLAARGPTHVLNMSNSSFVANAAGKGGSGGGIWVEDGAKAVLARTKFVNNTAASSYTHKGAGGGVAVSASASLTMSEGCVLEGNVAGPEEVGASDPSCLSGQGGGIHVSGSAITLSGVSLRRNRCETGALDAGCSGGAVSLTGRGPQATTAVAGDDANNNNNNDSGGAAFDDCLFEGNEARGAATNNVYSGAGQGGAAAIRFAFPRFTGCNFTGNAAEGGGGAAPATGGAVLLFLSRGGGSSAAAAAATTTTSDGGMETPPPTFVNCKFTSNVAGSGAVPAEGNVLGRGRRQGHGIGGALAAIASSPLLSGCSFWNNSAVAVFPSSSGGGGGGASTTVSGGTPSFGGAIMLASDCWGTRLSDCALGDNAAVNGVGGDLAVLAAPSKGPSSMLNSIAAATVATPRTAVAPEPSSSAGSASPTVTAAAAPVGAATAAAAGALTAPSQTPAIPTAVHGATTAAAAIQPVSSPLASSRQSSPGAAATATAVLSGCSFRPARPQSDPAVPWADGRSETAASPFLFVLDGGTVELVSPVFEAAGQAFVAQVDPPAFPSDRESEISHLRIVGSGGPQATGAHPASTGFHQNDASNGHRTRTTAPGAKLSVVSVGGRVSLVDTTGDDDRGAGNNDGEGLTKPAAAAAVAVDTTPFALRDLALLGAELFLEGGSDGDQRQQHRGLAVENSARFRTANVSAVASGAAGSGHDEAAADRRRWARGYPADAAVAGVTLQAQGAAKLGEAWEPKPFFLGTSLSQRFPLPESAELVGAGAGVVEGGGRHGPRSGGGEREADDKVSFDGVVVRLAGESEVQGGVSLAETAMVQVTPSGSLTLTGDATIRRQTSSSSSSTPRTAAAASPPPAVRNAGVLSLPRGFSLTVAGGVEQGPTGETAIVLPAPLYAPSPATGGCPEGSGEETFGGESAGGRGIWCVEAEGWGDATGHPLVVESGATRLAGAVNASVSRGGGEDERMKMNRKWAIVRFGTIDAALNVDTGSLSVRGPPGVSMALAMQNVTLEGGGGGRHAPQPMPDPLQPRDPLSLQDLEEHLMFTSSGRGDAKWTERERTYGDVGDQRLELVLQAVFIECRSMLLYANVTTAGGPCQACLLNMECSWCGGQDGMGCVPVEERPVKRGGRRGDAASSCQTGSCCPLGCNGVGECDYFSATCSCPWLYAGSSCADVSTKGAVALSLSLSALLLVMLSLACGRSSQRKQMEAVMGTLQELKRGLLSDTEGSIGDDDVNLTPFAGKSNRMAFSIGGRGQLPTGRGGGGSGSVGGGGGSAGGGSGSGLSYQHMWPRDYIQDLQQNLALRDVMVSFGELELGEMVGSGAAGTVWRGSWRGAAVAVKVIRRPFHQAMELAGGDMETFKREAYLMTRLRHPNIVLIMGVAFAPPGHRITLDGDGTASMSVSRRRELGFEDLGTSTQGSLCIVTELLSRGSLEDVIRRGGLRTASYGLILDLALQAARGMLYLHTHNPAIVHRDLKSSNLVIDEHWHAKVTDFGMSRFLPGPIPTVVTSSAAAGRGDYGDDYDGEAGAATATATATAAGSGSAHPLATRQGGGVGTGGATDDAHEDPLERSDESDPLTGAAASIELDRSGRGGGGRVGGAFRWGRDSRPTAGGARAGERGLGLTTNLGTVAWAAPEMLRGGEGGRAEYTAKVDVYSFGVVMWELWERRRPFEDLRNRFDIADTVGAGGRPPIGRGCPPPYADLIRRCWHQDPTKRPFFQDVVEDLEAEIEAAQAVTEL